MKRFVITFALVFVGLCAFGALLYFQLHWFAVHTGTSQETSVYYAFWSGFGSDLGEVTLISAVVASVITAYRHHNCHVAGCRRIGKPVEGTPYLACHIHHPAHEGNKRNVSVAQITAAHAAAHPAKTPAKKAAPK